MFFELKILMIITKIFLIIALLCEIKTFLQLSCQKFLLFVVKMLFIYSFRVKRNYFKWTKCTLTHPKFLKSWKSRLGFWKILKLQLFLITL